MTVETGIRDTSLATSAPCATPETHSVIALAPMAFGNNDCWLATTREGGKLVFKRNTGGRYWPLVTPAERRRRDIAGVLASRILATCFSTHPVIYRQATIRVGQQSYDGLVCDFVEGFRGLHEVPPTTIVNPEEALRQVVALAWMGDIDRIENPWNEGVTPDHRYFTLDFDFCFQESVSTLGLPHASRRALAAFGDRARLVDAISRIAALADDDIRAMVEAAGRQWVAGWDREQMEFYAGILIRNRDRLARTRSFSAFDQDRPGPLRAWANFAAYFIFKLNIPKKVGMLVRRQGAAATVRALLTCRRGRLRPICPRSGTG